MDEKEELVSHLCTFGFSHPAFWMEQLQEIGVQSKESLVHLEQDMTAFMKLKEKVRYPLVEIKALQKLLKIDTLENDKGMSTEAKKELSKERSLQLKEELKEHEEKAKALLKDLQKSRMEGQERHDKSVQQLESYMRELINISPESWISEDKSLEETIKILESRHEICKQLQSREWLSEKSLLETCSSGRALRGVLLTKNIEDLLEDRCRLLEVPENVLITGASESADKIEHFTSTHQEDKYEKAVNILGHGFLLSANSPIYGVALSASDRTEDQDTQESHSKEVYSSTVKYSTMQVASYSFEKKDLILSEDARSHLEKLSKMLKLRGASNANVEEECMKFFRTYGSHANRGPLFFGGKFKWTCSSRGFSKNDTETVKNMQSHAVSTSAGITFGGFGVSTELSMDKTKAVYKGKGTADIFTGSTLQIKITGGPLEATDLSLWRSGLLTNNSTWILTDRGKKFVAVWDIIRMNHSKELGDIKELLKTSWEKMAGLKAEEDLLDILSYDLDTVIEEIKGWSHQSLQLQQVHDNLEYLLKVKHDIVNKTASHNFWISEYLSHSSLQEFVMSLIISKQQCSRIKYLMNQLIEQDELKELSSREFPKIKDVSQWLILNSETNQPSQQEDIYDFDSFSSFLKGILDESRIAELEGIVSPEELALHVSKGIQKLRSHFQHVHLFYEDVFVAILIHTFVKGDFKFSGVAVLKPNSLTDLQSLHEFFIVQVAEFNTYKEMHAVNFQAYLFHLTIHLIGTKQLNFVNVIGQQMEKLQPCLEDVIHNELISYNRHCSNQAFKEGMHSLMTAEYQSQQQSVSPKNGIHSLKRTLKTPPLVSKPLVKDISLIPESNPKVLALLENLGLFKFYPKTLQLKDALCIRRQPLELSLNEEPPADATILPNLVLHRLMSYDIKCRSDLMPAIAKSCNGKEEEYDEYDEYEDDKDEGIHPLDILLALIVCSDDFLCQDLLSRLAKCQLAIPFLLPDPFAKQLTLPLWAMRSIIKEWKSTNQLNKEVMQKMQPIVDYKMPMVSFVRLGERQEHGHSKSKILNEVISDSHYDHFFHRDCPGGQQEVLLGEGLVDMCWYLPAGKPDDAFPDAVTFLNLHGDARMHLRQVKFLSQISSMCFILLTKEILKLDGEIVEILKKISDAPGGIVILNDVKKRPETLRKEIPKAAVINLPTKNAAKIKDHIRDRIKAKMFSDHGHKFKTIEELCTVQEEGIFVDESSDLYTQGLRLASEVKNEVIKCQAKNPNFKDIMLPLQGSSLWKKWAALDKELYRQTFKGNEIVNKYVAAIKRKKKMLRDSQLQHVHEMTPVMESFIESLLKHEGSCNRTLRNYFLQCLKLQLDSLSRATISGMQHQYQSAREELSILQTQSNCEETEVQAKIEDKKKRLEEIQEDIIDSSFGLEHLLRELGQVYEAALESQEYENDLSRLPKVAAELLIEGYPLELMDGDAAHVPLQWVVAVLQEAVKILKDPRVFVLSVLGLQSTGKSTMLNTAFGLQFNVSTGRCTRGAFIQLLKLDEDIETDSNCSYVLVVDTEGLRAPELDALKTQKHDNELATFVIGLANMTLINIYGEVAGDMDDILQTSVHAFLRMTEVKYKPSCQFVHQNAGANVNSQVGRAKFTQKLNQFTIEAAKEENCEGKFKSFNDVIKFNDLSDVHHFPGLWQGTPPMAPVDHGYSHVAQLLKKHFVDSMCKRASFNSAERDAVDLSLSSFQKRIGDLWNTLLKEKFVFSFKNTLEITAYNSLETAFSKWNWSFQQGMLEWEEKAENEITAAAADVIPQLVKQKCKSLRQYVLKELHQPLKSKMEAFFSGKQSETLAQWKAKFERRLDEVAKESQQHAEQYCRKLGDSRDAISTFEREKKTYAIKVTQRVQDHIADIRREQEKLNESLENNRLQPDQLRKILEKKIFTPENLIKYKEQGLISEDQVKEINALIQQNGGQLSTNELKKILVGGILAIGQVKKILKKHKQSEKELQEKFDDIWIELISKLQSVSGDPVDIEHEVEKKAIEFVGAKGGYDGQFIDKLQQKKSLKEWGPYFRDFLPEETKHYTLTRYKRAKRAVTDAFSSGTRREDDVYRKAVIEVTQRIISKAEQQLQKIVKRKTDFNPTFTQELLEEIYSAIKEESVILSDDLSLSFTREYKHEVYLVVCGLAITAFEEMANYFRRRNDPQVYLEEHIKGPLFTKFKNQYQQMDTEEAIASTLCAYFEGPIRVRAGNKLARKMVDVMKNSDHYFSSKMALKVKILLDLYREENFSSYMNYIENVKGYLEEKIKLYTVQFCDEGSGSKKTRLQVTAEEIVTELIIFVEGIVTDVNTTDIKEWLSIFCGNEELISELGLRLEASDLLSEYDIQHELNLENFKFQIRSALSDLKIKLHRSLVGMKCETEMAKWKNKPHELLVDLVGCMEQCPFCKEQCDLLQPNHVQNGQKHRVEVHRPDCLAGWRWRGVLTVDFCPAEVAGTRKFLHASSLFGHPYKDYQSVYPDWSIPQDTTSEGSLYWLWFVAKYKESLSKHYGAQPPDVDSDWQKHTWSDLEKNLKQVYHL